MSIGPTLRGQSQKQLLHDFLYFTWSSTGVPPLIGHSSHDQPVSCSSSPFNLRCGFLSPLLSVSPFCFYYLFALRPVVPWIKDSLQAPEAAAPGYAVRVKGGRWKAVVPHCADNRTLQPSLADDMMLFDLQVALTRAAYIFLPLLAV